MDVPLAKPLKTRKMKKSLLVTALFNLVFCFSAFSQWNTMASMLTGRGQHAAITHPNGKVYVWGGYDLTNTFSSLEIYDQASNSWSAGAPLPTVSRGFASALGLDSMIYSFSGVDLSGTITSCYKYNVTTNSWTTLAPIPTPVWESAAATAPNGDIFVFGGEGGLTLTQIYHPSSDTWTAGTPIPVGVEMEGAVTAPNGKIYLVGGYDGGSVIGNVQIYDPALTTWSAGATMTTPRNQFACTIHNTSIYTIGGKNSYSNNSGPFYNNVEIYNTTNGIWSTGTALPVLIGETKACTINGGINVIGGTDNAYQNTNYRLDINVGIQEIENVNVNLFPNPAKDVVFINLEGGNQNYDVNIYTLDGKMVYSAGEKALTGSSSLQVDLGNFAEGVYVISVISNKQVYNSKLVITK